MPQYPSSTSSAGELEVVQVAVRVRIFSERERQSGAKLIVRMTREMQGSKTFITNPDTGEEKEFKFDYSFNSHKNDPAVGPFATQDSVFEDLGKPVLANALEGKNVCLFAYGQTGSGKSYSMFGGKSGIAGEEGIIPRTCAEIFRVRDAAMADRSSITTHEITTEVIEVYCEQVNDLLLERSKWPPRGFPLRMTRGGFACPGTIKAPCASFAEVQKNFDRADRNRSIGAHQLNLTSSRAHTVFKIEYAKTTILKDSTGRDVRKQSIVSQFNLVDLAGSERTEIVGTSGQMLEEGKSINLSLSTLGTTIKALTTPGDRPNFRESKLTMLLMKSMTSGKVVMIAAISPACICYNETLSTLRFAERIKLVKIKVAKNITTDTIAEIQIEMERMRKSMQEEIDQLKEASRANPAAIEELRRVMEERSEEERNMRLTLQEELLKLKESAEERRMRIAAFNEQQDRDWEGVGVGRASNTLTVPHLVNLHEDPRLAETLVYPIDKPVVSCGRANPDDPPVLEFNGLGIVRNHCTFTYDGGEDASGRLFIVPGPKGIGCFVNGKAVTQRVELKHNYRVWLGNNYAFRVVFPGKEAYGDVFPEKPEGKPDYLMAEAELSKNNKQLAEAEKSKISPYLRHILTDAFRKVEQANLIASDLQINAAFSPKIVRNRETKQDDVVVHAELPQGSYLWSWGRFTSRLVAMIELWRSWQHTVASQDGDGGASATFEMPLNTSENPFIDEDYQLVGEADVYLASLANMIENPVEVTLLSMTGVQEGRLKVNISPLGKDGSEGPDFDDENDPFVDNPNDILNTTIQFQVQISQLLLDVDLKHHGGRPKYKDIFVRYKIDRNNPDEPFYETNRDTSEGMDIRFRYKREHTLFVDAAAMRHILKGCLVFQVWGKVADNTSSFSSSLFLSRRPSSVSSTRSREGSLSVNTGGAATSLALGGVQPILPALPPGWRKATVYISPDGKVQWEHPTVGFAGLNTGSSSETPSMIVGNLPLPPPAPLVHSTLVQSSSRSGLGSEVSRNQHHHLPPLEKGAPANLPREAHQRNSTPPSRRRLSVAFRSPCETNSPSESKKEATKSETSKRKAKSSAIRGVSCRTDTTSTFPDPSTNTPPPSPPCQASSPLPPTQGRISTPVCSNISPFSPNTQEANTARQKPIFLVRSVSSPPAMYSPDRAEVKNYESQPPRAKAKKQNSLSSPSSRSGSPTAESSETQAKMCANPSDCRFPAPDKKDSTLSPTGVRKKEASIRKRSSSSSLLRK